MRNKFDPPIVFISNLKGDGRRHMSSAIKQIDSHFRRRVNERFFIADRIDRQCKISVRHEPHKRPEESHEAEDGKDETPGDMWTHLDEGGVERRGDFS